MSGYSLLCKACKIFGICHEPEKLVAESCGHFIGTPPPDYYQVQGVTALFVENHWQGNKGYFKRPWGRDWMTQGIFDWEIKCEEERRASASTPKRRL
jgi:hypothetical protein